jgi:hypothetical protein
MDRKIDRKREIVQITSIEEEEDDDDTKRMKWKNRSVSIPRVATRKAEGGSKQSKMNESNERESLFLRRRKIKKAYSRCAMVDGAPIHNSYPITHM